MTALIAIDVQNDFMDIPSAALGVTGATKDAENIAKFVEKVNPNTIFASLDSHYGLDISHPSWWTNPDGSFVNPFTLIQSQDILNGKYTPRMDPKGSLAYVQALETNGEFQHFIWPEHCLIGTTGQSLYPVFSEALQNWMKRNLKWVSFINKGVNPYTEHFGIFRANVPNGDPGTEINQGVFQTLERHDVIYLVGEARTHCVANSLRQMLQIAPQLANKVVVLEDCMSNVPGLPNDFYTYVDSIYEEAKKQGVRFTKSTNV
jgi:nicotinamidase/pyrazinamidase